jgi:hypothetical protein
VIHLGDRIAAFVDGELPHEVRERVLIHLTGCAECRAAADAERVVKAGLAAIHGPRPSDDLTRRLLALAEPGEPLPPRRHSVDTAPRPPSVSVGGRLVPGQAGARPSAGPFMTSPPGGPSGRRGLLRRRQRLQFVTAAGVGVAAVALGAAVVMGGQEQPGPAVGPGDDWFAVQHAATTGGLPLVDPAMSMTIGLTDPDAGSLGRAGVSTGSPFTGAYFGGTPSP